MIKNRIETLIYSFDVADTNDFLISSEHGTWIFDLKERKKQCGQATDCYHWNTKRQKHLKHCCCVSELSTN